jgi:hypothetical protein
MWSAIMEQGKMARFRVREVFSGPKLETVDVWTDFICGVGFQEGESYLVYASRGNENRLEARGCSWTERISDAGDDLAYLHFIQYEGNAARIFGFATTSQLDLDRAQLWDGVTSPLDGLLVQVHSQSGLRYAYTDRRGRCVFDGLEEGNYKLTVFHRDYPENTTVLAGPREVHVNPRGRVSELFVIQSETRPK